MTEDRRSPAQDRLADLLGPLDGAQIPGGCDDCDAYQTVGPVTAGVWGLTVHHDDDCPFLHRTRTRGPRSRRKRGKRI
jgi:hypothetical protein